MLLLPRKRIHLAGFTAVKRTAECLSKSIHSQSPAMKSKLVPPVVVHDLTDGSNPKAKTEKEPEVAELSHMVHKHRTAEPPDQETSLLKSLLGRLGFLKGKKSPETTSKRSYSPKWEETEKGAPSVKAWEPVTARSAGQEFPPKDAGPSARVEFNRDLFAAGAISYMKKQKALHRPMSPHLTIFAPQWTWVPSIVHRMTGMILVTSLYGLGIGVMFTDHHFPYYVDLLRSLHIPIVILYLTKFGLGSAFSFHMLNGIRHLVWDTGRGFRLQTLYRTAYLVTALSIAGGLALATL